MKVFGETAMVPEGEGRLKTAHYLGSQQSLNKVCELRHVFKNDSQHCHSSTRKPKYVLEFLC